MYINIYHENFIGIDMLYVLSDYLISFAKMGYDVIDITLLASFLSCFFKLHLFSNYINVTCNNTSHNVFYLEIATFS